MTKEAYCSYEVSKLLKEKGFSEKCTACYRTDLNNQFELISGRVNFCNPRFNKFKSIPPLNAPTQQVAMRWLRERGIFINIDYMIECPTFKYYIYLDDSASKHTDFKHYPTYEEAVESALKYCLENLIQKSK